MQIFYFLFVLFITIICIPHYSENKLKPYEVAFFPFHAFFLILIISLFFGLRNVKLGVDSVEYLRMYRVGDYGREHGEPIFALLIKILHNILFGDKAFLFTMSCIISLLCFVFYSEISTSDVFKYCLILSCFYYFYIFHLSLYRNTIAIGLVNIAFIRYKKRDWITFFILGIIASCIHYSAILFIGFPFIDYFGLRVINSRKRHLFLFVFLLIFFFTSFMDILVALIPPFCQPVVVFKEYFLRARYYLSSTFHITHSHFISLFIIIIFNLNFNRMKKTKYFDLYIFHSVYFVFIALFKDSVGLYDRLYFYIQLFEPILIFEYRNLFKEKRLASFLICLLTILYSIFTIFIWGPRNLIQPYYL